MIKGTGRGRRRKDGAGGNRFPWGIAITVAATVSATIAILLFLAISSDARRDRIDQAAEKFQARYWETPIPAQGLAPDGYAEPAKGLSPENCALCHYRQYQDWKESFHAKAMGPGVVGQFPAMEFSGQASCLECHAPMTEQWAKIRTSSGKWKGNAAFQGTLREKGLTCSACHLRSHTRFAPEPTAEEAAAKEAAGMTNASASIHGETTRTPHFRASEFCKGCHQHTPATIMPGGKTIENTYNEWLDSEYAEKGVACQQCHMPDGRHLWRGIHNPEMTRSGVTITADAQPDPPVEGEEFIARLSLRNTGTGHSFPTYTTPAVFLRAAFLDDEGKVLQGQYYEEKLLQRRLDMSSNPWGEKFDTRLAPGEQAELEFKRTVPQGAASVYLWVWVEPDHFYTGFYRSYLKNGDQFPGGKKLRTALKNSLDSRYLLFSRKIPVKRRS
jgi:hypothetical protein